MTWKPTAGPLRKWKYSWWETIVKFTWPYGAIANYVRDRELDTDFHSEHNTLFHKEMLSHLFLIHATTLLPEVTCSSKCCHSHMLLVTQRLGSWNFNYHFAAWPLVKELDHSVTVQLKKYVFALQLCNLILSTGLSSYLHFPASKT